MRRLNIQYEDPPPEQERSCHIRRLTPQERLLWAPGLQIKYRELSGIGLGGATETEHTQSMLFGEVILVEYAGAPAAAIHLAAISPGDASDVHILRWGEIPRDLWLAACRSVARWAFTQHKLLRIEAYIPVSCKGALELASAVGFTLVGTIPKGIALPDGHQDTELWVLIEESLHG